jgi:hypothetical protein
LSYLRFTLDEFQLIWEACRGVDFQGDYFSGFKRYLVDSLTDVAPDLARLVARFRRQKLQLLYRYVRERKQLFAITAIFQARHR